MGNAELVKLLLTAGANPTEKMDDGKTPVEMAEGAGEVIALLKE